MNIIGDIAGNYETLCALLRKMPPGPVLSVGDMGDRGPRSREVLELFKNTRGFSALKGNHEEMLVNAMRNPLHALLWVQNGGDATIRSFGEQQESGRPNIDAAMVDWIDALPLYYQEPGLLVTHAPFAKKELPPNDLKGPRMSEFVWRREPPAKRDGLLQVFGHNSHWGLDYFGPMTSPWAICIDTSHQKVLTGLHWPSLRIYQQEYID